MGHVHSTLFLACCILPTAERVTEGDEILAATLQGYPSKLQKSTLPGTAAGRGLFVTKAVEAGTVLAIDKPPLYKLVSGDYAGQWRRQKQARDWLNSVFQTKKGDDFLQVVKTAFAMEPVKSRVKKPCSIGPEDSEDLGIGVSPELFNFADGFVSHFSSLQAAYSSRLAMASQILGCEDAVRPVVLLMLVFITNYFGHEGKHAAFAPLMAMPNTACFPNAFVEVSSHSAELRAAQPLQKGDEVFVSYIDTYEYTDVRRAHLRSAYGFTCQCPCCRKDFLGCPSLLEAREQFLRVDYRQDIQEGQRFVDSLRAEHGTLHAMLTDRPLEEHLKIVGKMEQILARADESISRLHPVSFRIAGDLGETLMKLRHHTAALPFLLRALAMLDAVLPRFWDKKLKLLEQLVKLCKALGLDAAAKTYNLRHTAVAHTFRVPALSSESLDDGIGRMPAEEFAKVRAGVFAHLDLPSAFGDDFLLKTRNRKGKGASSEL